MGWITKFSQFTKFFYHNFWASILFDHSMDDKSVRMSLLDVVEDVEVWKEFEDLLASSIIMSMRLVKVAHVLEFF